MPKIEIYKVVATRQGKGKAEPKISVYTFKDDIIRGIVAKTSAKKCADQLEKGGFKVFVMEVK